MLTGLSLHCLYNGHVAWIVPLLGLVTVEKEAYYLKEQAQFVPRQIHILQPGYA